MASFPRREVVDALFHDLLKEFSLSELAMQQLEEGTMNERDYFNQLQAILDEFV